MAASLGHALAVRVEEGRHFPRDGGAAFRVAATFDDESRTSVRLLPPQHRVPHRARRTRAYTPHAVTRLTLHIPAARRRLRARR